MGLDGLPDSGNKFTGSRMIVPGLGLSTYKVQKNDVLSIRKNIYAGSIPPSPTPTPSITPTNTPTPTVTPTPTPSPIIINTYTINSNGGTYLPLNLVSSGSGIIDWGDGNTTVVNLGSANYNHTYSSPFTGDATVTINGFLTTFTTNIQILPNNTGVFIVDTSQFLNNNTISVVSTSTSSGDLQKYDTCSSMNYLIIQYDTTLNFSELPTSINNISLGFGGNTTISDDITNLSLLTGTTSFNAESGNTIYGDVVNIPSNMSVLNVFGSNTISGDTNDIPATLSQLNIKGLNTITGDIADLPPINLIDIEGLNTITGDIANIPNMNATNLTIISNNSTIYGHLSGMTGFSIDFFTLSGSSMMISGTTSDIPVNGIKFNVTFDNLTGDLNNMNKTDFPSIMIIEGNSSITYTSGTWPLTMSTFNIETSQYLQSPQFDVDQFLIDLDDDVTWSGTKDLTIYGDRTVASDSAVSSLTSKGVTVTVYGP
jgi:hypothetical protein